MHNVSYITNSVSYETSNQKRLNIQAQDLHNHDIAPQLG
ncbi:Hypothetical protein ETEE_2550 [Edwardsiella anguillarum ET080813]|uniref:Uncharacterized protein n=1 Tax=Edwardsiella anguillarum ET080813 TaxID=667120 RepID=A0A076LQZ5_9GAMM|nr:Hypothetical protein ETEE_2550 [Edwardsiella anguillarum ET080813]